MAEFDYQDFLDLCHHYPVDLEKIDLMLENAIDLNKHLYDIHHDFLSEVMDEHLEGKDDAYRDGNEEVDNWYLYELVKRILDKGFDLSGDEWKNQDECLEELYFTSTDAYIPEILKLFLDAGADVKRIINNNDYDEERAFVLANITDMLGGPENSIFEDCTWGTVAKIICRADEGLPYSDIHSIECCTGGIIENILCNIEGEREYRIILTNGLQVIIGTVWSSYMDSVNNAIESSFKVTQEVTACKGKQISSIRTFYSINKERNHGFTNNIWLYLNDGYILKFTEFFDNDDELDISLAYDNKDSKE